MDNKTIKIGVGVMILRDKKVLLGKRITAIGDGQYAFTGGHLEYGESFEDCAIRETREEAGIEIKNVRYQLLANLMYPRAHYIHIGILADWKSGEAKVLEPDKRENWDWYELDKLPEPLMEAAQIQINSYKIGKQYLGTLKFNG